MQRIARMRERIALELGLVVPAIRVGDNRSLSPTEYSIRLRGIALGRWKMVPDGLLAVARRPGESGIEGVTGPDMEGVPTVWIADVENLQADEADHDFMRPPQALAAHLEAIVREHAAELLGREEVSRMLEELRQHSPTLVDDLVPEVLRVSDLHQVLQQLLAEGVSIRDLESILETLGRLSDQAFDLQRAVVEVRRTLARSVCSPSMAEDGKVHAVLLEPALEEFLLGSMETVGEDTLLNVDPQTMESVCGRTAEAVAPLRRENFHPAVLCSARIRPHFWRVVANRVPRLSVLSYDEVFDESLLEVHGSVSLDTPPRMYKEVKRERCMTRSLDSKPQQ